MFALTASMLSLATSQDFQGYNFAADAESLLDAPLVKEFSCEGRDYGYFADVANNCQVFHICWPKMNELEEIIGMNQWSFICGNQTVFDQSSLTCNHVTDAFPCEESESLFNRLKFRNRNSYPAFGIF